MKLKSNAFVGDTEGLGHESHQKQASEDRFVFSVGQGVIVLSVQCSSSFRRNEQTMCVSRLKALAKVGACVRWKQRTF